jgi:hypothetical protein
LNSLTKLFSGQLFSREIPDHCALHDVPPRSALSFKGIAIASQKQLINHQSISRAISHNPNPNENVYLLKVISLSMSSIRGASILGSDHYSCTHPALQFGIAERDHKVEKFSYLHILNHERLEVD